MTVKDVFGAPSARRDAIALSSQDTRIPCEFDCECEGLTLDALTESSYKNSREHGFWADADFLEENGHKELVYRYVIPTKLMLMVSELSEALDNIRDGTLEKGTTMWYTDTGKPDGFATELADAIIRILDVVGYLDIDITEVIREKEKYNRTRPPKHGKAI